MKYCVLFLFMASMSTAAQKMVVAGPFGVPIQIEDEYGSWSIPITVYEDKDVDIMIPDVTSPGWMAWNSPQYLKEGKFWVDLYSFFKTDYVCLNVIIPTENRQNQTAKDLCKLIRYEKKIAAVDTRTQTVSFPMRVLISQSGDGMVDGLMGSKTEIPLESDSLGPRTKVAIKHIVSLVQNELGGPSQPTATIKKSHASPLGEDVPPNQINAESLFSDYRDNEVAADQRYKGKIIEVGGRVGRIRKDFLNNAVLELATSDRFEYVSAYLKDSSVSFAATLSPGDNVTVLCRGAGMVLGTPMLRDCSIK